MGKAQPALGRGPTPAQIAAFTAGVALPAEQTAVAAPQEAPAAKAPDAPTEQAAASTPENKLRRLTVMVDSDSYLALHHEALALAVAGQPGRPDVSALMRKILADWRARKAAEAAAKLEAGK